MLPHRIYLIDSNGALCSAWRDAFAGIEAVVVEPGDFFAREADAMVSPANRFGIMDGGLDAAIGVADIALIVVPGMGTGIGGVAPGRRALQMRMAFNAVSAPARIPSFSTIHGTHRLLAGA